jgi:predicted Zn-dependent protease with MMP-like domain
MPRTQISCPRCRQPVMAEVEQLFDVTSDPGAKQRLLSNVVNRVACPYCGYDGTLATPLVYHDASKELLLTYFPAEIGLPINEQEKLIGPLIKQVVDRLPPEKRKAYLLSPQSHLTYQSFIERILAADGITPEMLRAQQERIELLERLLSASSADVRTEIIKQNATKIDEAFFALFSRLMQSAMASGQQQVAQQMAGLQEQLLKETEYGRKLQASVGEIEAAARSLQEAGQGLTREKLLDIMLAAPNDNRLRALVSMARPGMDYIFFQTLTERIDKAEGEVKARLEEMREKLLDMVNQVDLQIQERIKQAEAFLEQLLQAPDIRQATQQNLEQFDQAVVEALNNMLRAAERDKDAARMEKLKQVVEVLNEASAPPPEFALIEQFLGARNEQELEKMIAEYETEITPQFLDAVASLVMQMESMPEDATAEERVMAERLQLIYRHLLRQSMKKKMQ